MRIILSRVDDPLALVTDKEAEDYESADVFKFGFFGEKELAVLDHLLYARNKDSIIYGTVRGIAKDIGACQAVVSKAFNKLYELELLECIGRGLYRLKTI